MSEDGPRERPTGPTLPAGPRKPARRQASTAEGKPAAGRRLGRYVLEKKLGRGGMGVVYLAYDPELDRQVALKLVRVRRGTAARALLKRRLLREAQALAQLSHPNVVTVFDVGTYEGGVFLAMEYVRGRTLGQIWKEEAPGRRRVLEIMAAAGEGLAAAHRAGLVHRDFKPANVMLGDDGRVRVLDFSVARAMTAGLSGSTDGDTPDGEPSPASPETPGSTPARLLQESMTLKGSLVGTPAYMAPEQLAGDPADERADQFAFCVVLYEALYGARPFDGKNPNEIRHKIVTRQLEEHAPRVPVPRWLKSVVLRGLQPTPEERFPTMDALLVALGRERRNRRRRFVAGVLAAAGLLGGGGMLAGLHQGARPPEEQCASAGAAVDEVWNPGRAARLREALAATGRDHASETSRLVTERLDAYVAAWKEVRTDACVAFARGIDPPDHNDRRLACLDRRRRALDAFVETFSTSPTPEAADQVAPSVYELPALDVCARDILLLEEPPLPADPEARRRAQDLQARLDRATALERAGHVTDATRELREVVAASRALGHPPLLARALSQLGQVLLHGAPDEAREILDEAAMTAARAQDDAVIAEAWVARLQSLLQQARFDDALALRELVAVAVERSGDADLQARLAYSTAWLYIMKVRLDEAREAATEALELWRDRHGEEHPGVAMALVALANASLAGEDAAAAIDLYRRAIAVQEKTLGKSHPDLKATYHNLAQALLDEGRLDEAAAAAGRARRIAARTFPPGHPQVASELWLEGRVHLEKHAFRRAYKFLEEAVSIYEATPDADPAEHSYAVHLLGLALDGLGDRRAAISRHREAVRLGETTFGADDPDTQTYREALERSLAGRRAGMLPP